MLAGDLHRACLRALVARFLEEGNSRTCLQVDKSIVQHTVAMEIDLASVGSRQEAEASGFIDPDNGAERLGLMGLDVALHPADVVLQPAAGPLEGVVDGKARIGK